MPLAGVFHLPLLAPRITSWITPDPSVGGTFQVLYTRPFSKCQGGLAMSRERMSLESRVGQTLGIRPTVAHPDSCKHLYWGELLHTELMASEGNLHILSLATSW